MARGIGTAEGIDRFDPRGLIRESFNIENIHPQECRSIFLDWALFEEISFSQRDMLQALLDHYGPANPDHPMTQILREGLAQHDAPRKRRGGRAGRSPLKDS